MEPENKTTSLLGKIAILILVVGAGAYIISKNKNGGSEVNQPTNDVSQSEISTEIDSRTDVEIIGSEMESFDTNFDDLNAEDLDI